MESNSLGKIVNQLEERAKELNCIFKIENYFNNPNLTFDEAIDFILKKLPLGFLFPKILDVKIVLEGREYRLNKFPETPCTIYSDILVQDSVVGKIQVFYSKEMPQADHGSFLNSEIKMLNTIAQRFGHFVLHQRVKIYFSEFENVIHEPDHVRKEWRVILDVIRRTEPNLFVRLLRKILHQLCYENINGAEKLLQLSSIDQRGGNSGSSSDENKPAKKKKINDYDDYVDAILGLAEDNLSDEFLLTKIQKWIRDDRSSGLIKVLENQETSLLDISDAIRKYYHLAPEKFKLSLATVRGLRVSLLRRFYSEKTSFINVAKEYVKITDFYELIDKMVYTTSSHGKLGGKSAGLFLAKIILQKIAKEVGITLNLKAPKTWHVASDGIMSFMHYNDLEDVYEQKYKDMDEVQLEYPQIVQVFKNSDFPPEMVKGLSVALDDFGDKPLVVRSSSLMEDQLGAAFSGKYKSLFLANQGPKQERLFALLDAIAEVYASTFSPDPIEYRAERGLLDYHEEMGIMIQEVVGDKVGKYFCPAFAGVAFSNNEFRWSPRIQRQDGLVRIVPGLGTRAVDRVSDDYPILAAPGLPNLRVNITPQETFRYSPKKIDVINLETNEFQTIEISELLNEVKDNYPLFNKVFSVFEGNMIRPISGIGLNVKTEDLVPNFEGLFQNTDFLNNINIVLKTLEEKFGTPVDLEFACDKNSFYLLQCRPQHYSVENTPDPIPQDYPKNKILFSANRYVSNGKVNDIGYIVYVDPDNYSQIPTLEQMQRVGRAIGKLNKRLPKREFILMGPGRWGSRGDIKLGVNVTYSDINNTAMLIEIAMRKGAYVPDLSFGTHFFQDLSEASIRYLPLYPGGKDVIFNDSFFANSENMLKDILPKYEDLENVIKVIDVRKVTKGHILKVLVNADIDQALAIIALPEANLMSGAQSSQNISGVKTDYSAIRVQIAKSLVEIIDKDRYGILGIYLSGSTKNQTAGPNHDIDLTFHLNKKRKIEKELVAWLDGWSRSMGALHFIQSGYENENMIHATFVYEDDLKSGSAHIHFEDSLPLFVTN